MWASKSITFWRSSRSKPGHDRDDEDEDGHAQGHAEDRDESDDGNESALRFEVAEREEETERKFQGSHTFAENDAFPTGIARFRKMGLWLISAGRLPACRLRGGQDGRPPGRAAGPTSVNQTTARATKRDYDVMLWTIAIVLFVLWLIGWLGFHLLGAAIHILVILAIICVVIALVKGL